MRFSTQTQLADLQILLNLANFPGDLTGKLHDIMRVSGYVPAGEKAHKATLYVDDAGPRVRIRFSYIDDQTKWEPVRSMGSFYLKAVWADAKWSLTGDY